MPPITSRAASLRPPRMARLVPVSLLYRATTPLDGSAPLLLYGYGAYGISMPASFSTNRLSLVDRGFIYAIAHIRGGKDKGYRWYREGRRELKTNTFTDFIAAGRYLASNGFTGPGSIVAHGGSAGGMLMGAVANMAPELFRGIIAEVPFVDVLNTMLDETLPLTPPEWPEWGNPIVSGADYLTIEAYSPYDNVKAAGLSAYPGHRRPDRSARHLLGAGEMGRPAAGAQDRQQPVAAQDQHGSRPWRRVGPFRPAEGSGAVLCFRPDGCGAGGRWHGCGGLTRR